MTQMGADDVAGEFCLVTEWPDVGGVFGVASTLIDRCKMNIRQAAGFRINAQNTNCE